MVIGFCHVTTIGENCYLVDLKKIPSKILPITLKFCDSPKLEILNYFPNEIANFALFIYYSSTPL